MGKESTFPTPVNISNIVQLDGNDSNISDITVNSQQFIPPAFVPGNNVSGKPDKITAALSLPVVATYNLRSLFPKIGNLTTDMLERSVDVGFLSEIWENTTNAEHSFEIEKLLETSGLKYISTTRPPSKNGVSYGGAAIVVNLEKFSVEKLNVHVPNNLEIIWGLLKPKTPSAKFKRIVICSFYSPPKKQRNSKMADHIVSTLQMLTTQFPECGIILGADRNYMDIKPILNCGLRLKQVVDLSTRQGAILDIIIMNTNCYYNTPIIVPPIKPDDPQKGKPSDHWVPVCTPHTDRYKPANRNFRTVKYRPLPESSIRQFGEWIVKEGWQNIEEDMSPSDQAMAFERILQNKLDTFCPEKSMKISSQDKPWIDKELKTIARKKGREYNKRGKTLKYKKLSKDFDVKYKIAAEKFLRKNMDNLMESKPGQAYNILKRMGAQPGDCIDSNTFTLPAHEEENLSDEQSAERIASHFAAISQEFPPLDTNSLPAHVKEKLASDNVPPAITEYDVYCKILAAKKPKSGVPGDIPRELVKEFSPELATPLTKIIRNILHSGDWPRQWKMEFISAISKVPLPETEDDLRPISLTSFFSKVTEHFVVMWLLEYIGDKIDFRQYGGSKGNSITHYLIEFINFVLLNQDSDAQTAILACMVDFSKAFNRINHNLLVTKLSDMGCPGWLLRVVIAFLSNRRMVVRYKGKQSTIKSLPGGGPQGTLLGLFLFLVLINDAGFEGQLNNAGELATSRRNIKAINQIHLKYVDDMSLAESVNLKELLVSVPDRDQPDNFHARTGHALPDESSAVYRQLVKTTEYADRNQMKINFRKTKTMLFNPCTSVDFMPNFQLGGHELELVEEMRLLGLVITSDMKWAANTEYIVKRAYKKLWVMRRLKELGANRDELVDIFVKQVRSILELAVPAWHGALKQADTMEIERVQKAALHIVLGPQYISYRNALKTLNLTSLDSRREKLCLKFANKAVKDPKHSQWFKLNTMEVNTRQEKLKYCTVIANKDRYKTSPISYLTTLLNQKK